MLLAITVEVFILIADSCYRIRWKLGMTLMRMRVMNVESSEDEEATPLTKLFMDASPLNCLHSDLVGAWECVILFSPLLTWHVDSVFLPSWRPKQVREDLQNLPRQHLFQKRRPSLFLQLPVAKRKVILLIFYIMGMAWFYGIFWTNQFMENLPNGTQKANKVTRSIVWF